VLPFGCTPAAETISGRAMVIDGDSLEIGSISGHERSDRASRIGTIGIDRANLA
jgi:hypothetical protein